MRNPKHLRQIAVRSVRANQFNFDDNTLNVSGYVNETGKPSDPIPNWGETEQIPDDESFVEVMQPGVFRDAIRNADFVDFYMEHDPDKYLASTQQGSKQQGSLSLSEDNTGLKMSANIVPTSWGRDTYTLIKSGAVKSMSFGFIPLQAEWDLNGTTPVRTVTKIQLLEVSAVRFPAYPDSSIDARKKHFKRLNQILERRGFTLSNFHNKRGVKNMVKETVKKDKKQEKRAGGNNPAMNSADVQGLTTAVNNMTNAIQENSEILSNIASQVMQSANDNRSKKDVHKKSEKSEKDDGKAVEKKRKAKEAEKPKETKVKKPKKSEKPKRKAKVEKPKDSKKSEKPKEDPKAKERAKKAAQAKEAAKKRSAKADKIMKNLGNLDEKL